MIGGAKAVDARGLQAALSREAQSFLGRQSPPLAHTPPGGCLPQPLERSALEDV